MIDKTPESYGWFTYLWVVVLAIWGGVNNYIGRVKSGYVEKFSLFEFVGEMSISAFAGIMAFYLCEWAQLPQPATAAMVGISGHMGGRSIFMIEQAIKNRLGITAR